MSVISRVVSGMCLPAPALPKAAQLPPAAAGLRQIKPATGDIIRFEGRTADLCAKCGINPDTLPVVPADAKLAVDKRTLVTKILEAHEQALKNKLLGNYSDRHFSSNILLNNGTWGLATNIEMSRDRAFCGERSALVDAWNAALAKLPLRKLEKATPEQLRQIQNGLQVKLLTFAQGASPEVAWDACAECLSWMATTRYFSPDTQLAHLWRNPDTGELALRIGSVKGHLPLANLDKVSQSTLPIAALSRIELTPKAEAVVRALSATPAALTPDRMKRMLQVAKTAYEANTTAELSGKKLGAAVLMSDGQIAPGQRFDWTQRWNTQADLAAGVKAFQEGADADQPPFIVAVAYYGDDADVPSEPSLGYISQGRGNGDTLFIKIEDNDAIQVRTLRDYMPYVYISSKANRKL